MATKKPYGPLIPVAVTGVLFAAVIALWLTNGPGRRAPTPVAIEAGETVEVEAQPADPLGFSFAILPFLLGPDAPVSAATAAELTDLVTDSQRWFRPAMPGAGNCPRSCPPACV